MALFMIERNFAAEFNASAADYAKVVELNDQAGVKWLYSFLSADKRKTYCLYEAKSGDEIREAARLAGLPADIVIERPRVGLEAGEVRVDVRRILDVVVAVEKVRNLDECTGVLRY